MSVSQASLAQLQTEVENFVDLNAALSSELEALRREQKDTVKLIGVWHNHLPANVVDRIIGFVAAMPTTFQWNRYPDLVHADNDPVLPYHPMHFARADFPDGFQVESHEEQARLVVKTRATRVMAVHMRHEYGELLRRVQVRRANAARVAQSIPIPRRIC